MFYKTYIIVQIYVFREIKIVLVKNMRKIKKIIVSIIIGLLLTTSIVSVNAFDKGELTGSSRSSDPPYADIYVDDDNTEGPWYGTLEYPYQHIEDGVNAADPGDIIFVFNGNYSKKSIYFTKPLKLIGEDKYNTIINEPYYQVLKVDGFELRNFCLKGSQPKIHLSGCSNCTISGNFLFKGTDGISISNSSNIIVSNNIIQDVRGTGIQLRGGANNNQITNNYLNSSDGRGISIIHDSCDNVVANNTINNYIGSEGIYLDHCNKVYVYDNVIMNSSRSGIYLRYVSNSIISRNKIIDIYFTYSKHYGGIYMDRVNDTLVSDNIIKNTYKGVYVDSSCNSIYGNVINNCTYALILSGSSNVVGGEDENLKNIFSDNYIGIKIEDGFYSRIRLKNHNVFINNRIDICGPWLDAESQPSSQQKTMFQQIRQLVQNIIYNIKLRYQTTNV